VAVWLAFEHRLWRTNDNLYHLIHSSLPWLDRGYYPTWSATLRGCWYTAISSLGTITYYNTHANLFRTWAVHSLSSQRRPKSFTVDPLQDLVVIVSSPGVVTVTDAEQDHHAIWVECWSGLSQRPHPDSVCALLECRHNFDPPRRYDVDLVGEPAICGDRICIYYSIQHSGKPAVTFIPSHLLEEEDI